MALVHNLLKKGAPWPYALFPRLGASVHLSLLEIIRQETSPSNQKETEVDMDKHKKGLFIGASKFNSAVANIAAINIKFAWLFIVAVLMQRIPFALSAPSSFVELKKALLILSYVLLLWALSHNLHLRSMRILTLGTVLNFAAIVTNGGLMPVSPAARLEAGMTAIGQSGFGKVLPEGTGVLLPVEQTNLWFFSDIIPVSLVVGVISPGDVLIGVGLLIFAVEAMRGKTSPSPCINQVREITNGYQKAFTGQKRLQVTTLFRRKG